MDSSRVLASLLQLAGHAEDSDGGPDGQVASPDVLRSLLWALDFRDRATLNHSGRVALLAVGMAQQLGWEGRALRVLEVAALLHDIGKIGVPDHVLHKPGPLSVDETELVAAHHSTGVALLQACRIDRQVIECVGCAHGQTLDVTAPTNSIPLGSRILAVADAYDSLSHDQSYRQGLPHEKIISTLLEQPAQRFDRNLIHALARWIEKDGLRSLTRDADPAVSQATESPAAEWEDFEITRQANLLCHLFSYLHLLGSLYDGFYILDASDQFVIWSRGAESLLKRPSGSVLGKRRLNEHLNYVDGRGLPIPPEALPHKLAQATGEQQCSMLRAKLPDGEILHLEVQALPLLGDDGALLGVAEIIHVPDRSRRQPELYRELQRAASTDALTGMANRAELESRLRTIAENFEDGKSSGPYSVIFVDLDHFKQINDTFSHAVGDRVLVETAALLQDELYSGEVVGRYGGEEFVILCPDTDLDAAYRRAERLRKALLRSNVGGQPGLEVSASFGVAQAEPGDTAESVRHRADEALFEAKEAGRNRTCTRTSGSTTPAPVAAPAVAETPEESALRYTTEFQVRSDSELLFHKLRAFVSETQARLRDADDSQMRLLFGRPGPLGRWGSAPAKCAVELTVKLVAADPSAPKSRRCVTVAVTITPEGWGFDADRFRRRAAQVANELRSYLLAE
ncbi:putative diguanylate cyclase YdaM [Maioricimonas rarisocia]|uniref:diguanylate cyclase n=1 Tax=Maioricimonas rarisocia TaxID=2528026 RepID=A0A517ZCV3_9PLAN|nr:diguanylate cyclase [Maioricimonas rarisocia]QDU40297.1 putative diguanylate cyclase YdaM [Maioricimonas rarisocia]